MGFLTQNKGIKSPVTKYIEFKSNDEGFSYYDKETQGRVEVKAPFTFIALDDLVGVSGGEMDDAGQYHPVNSGIVAHVNKELTVKKDGATIATGKWADVKEATKAAGGRYTAYTYAILNKELVCFKFAGASLASWFSKGEGDTITFKKCEEMKKGAIKYNSPIFETKELTDAEIKALDDDENVATFKEFYEAKLAQNNSEEEETEETVAPKPNLEEDVTIEQVDF